MTLTPIHRTPPADPDDIMSDILRTLRDADAPVPVADLDDAAPDRRAVAQALSRLARQGLIDIAAGHVTIARSHLRRKPEQPNHPEPTPPPAPTPQTPKPAPSTRDVLGLITQTLTKLGPMTPTEPQTHLPRATHPRIPAAINLGAASGAIGRRDNTLFAVTPTHRVRRRAVRQRGSA